MGRYVGRFAPTPSGPLHLGSLVTATASFLDARAVGGMWRLRIDDLDAPRVAPGAIDDILRALDSHGLHWDGAVNYQSANTERHRAALDELCRQSLCFRCRCSRRELRGQRVYPGTCRHRGLVDGADGSGEREGLAPRMEEQREGLAPRMGEGREGPAPRMGGRREGLASRTEVALRIRVPDVEVAWRDRVQGRHAQRLATDVGDFIVRRRDGHAAYPLAVVVDDAEAGVTDIVRGADLLDETPRQRFLMQRLGLAVPRYLHVPVVVGRDGAKLSKANAASAVLATAPAQGAANLRITLALLGQAAPAIDAVDELLAWAAAHWRVDALPCSVAMQHWTSL